MTTTWKNQETGEEWGKGITVVTNKGTVWGPGHATSSGFVPPITQNIDPNTPEAVSEAPAALPEPVEGFPCRHEGCTMVAKSAAGLAAHARKAH